MKVTVIPIVIGALGTVTKGLVQGLADLEIRGMGGDPPNYSIVEISQNTKKSPGDLRILAVTRTPVENHQLMLVWKTLKWVYNNKESEKMGKYFDLARRLKSMEYIGDGDINCSWCVWNGSQRLEKKRLAEFEIRGKSKLSRSQHWQNWLKY